MSFQEHVPLLEGLSAGAGPTERSGGGAAPADAAAAGPVPAIASPVQAGPSSQIGPPAEPLEPAPEAGPEPAPLPINPRPFGAGPPPMAGRGSGSPRRLLSPQEAASANRQLTPEQKLLILDTWQRSGLPALDFGALVGVSRQTLYAWKNRFEQLGPAGLDEEARKKMPTGSKLPEVTKRTILMLKKANPDWGCQRLSDVLYRGPGLPASAAAVARVLKEAGYVTEELPTTPHPDHPRSFERAAPNQLWQTDLFTFILKRQNRRVYLVGFMDDHSRFITGYGLHASQSAALVLEVFRAALTSCGSPQEVLTDNGSQYVTWRGTSAFARELQKRGIQHVISAPRHPQTLGKIERFWGSLWRECLESAVFLDLADARSRIGQFIDYYNFQRPHQSLDGLTPADRFFGAASQMLTTLKARVQANALELARNGSPKAPFYVAGQVGGRPFSVHAEGERVFMVQEGAQRREIDLVPPAPPAEPVPAPVCAQGIVTVDLPEEPEPAPGTSPLDQGLAALAEGLAPAQNAVPTQGAVPAQGADPIALPPQTGGEP